ncbi:hypothetical protein Pse7367_1367 [Thalassoporum mexicanum PCC 7367]|uniref:hypothetical protein n=1 Tax=Thalassoporum mexicanum TaxID=3457544 RepID=UPI00029F9FCD|nr:hypothetical protein [Pseudanabaena sp. PCC 7367]AFY69659.1 hypothetical protein Pse7367_1367 [Pseudanabaena sp. PCC 7367]
MSEAQSGISLAIVKHSDYDNPLAQINVNEKSLAFITQEEGLGQYRIEFPTEIEDGQMVITHMDLAIFEEAIEKAKQALSELGQA